MPALTTTEPEHQLSPSGNLEARAWSEAGTAAGRVEERQAIRRRDAQRVRQLRAGAEWHLHEVR